MSYRAGTHELGRHYYVYGARRPPPKRVQGAPRVHATSRVLRGDDPAALPRLAEAHERDTRPVPVERAGRLPLLRLPGFCRAGRSVSDSEGHRSRGERERPPESWGVPRVFVAFIVVRILRQVAAAFQSPGDML